MMKPVAVLIFIAFVAIPPVSNAQIISSALTMTENEFALDLCRQVAAKPGNFIFSPSSIYTALGMVYAGSKGKTATELARTLHIDELQVPPGQNLAATYLQTMVKYDVAAQGKDPNVMLNTANALWGAPNYRLNADYLKTIADTFGGALTPVEFSKRQQAAVIINGWVAAHTEGKIFDLIGPQILGPDTRLVLTNAVYFKGHWSVPFDVSQTAPAPFHISAGRAATVPMMSMTGELSYREADSAQILTLYYGYSGASMTVFLPKPHVSLTEVERGITVNLLTQMPGPAKVAVQLPKFTIESAFDLNGMLEQIGIHDVFDHSKADLSGIAADPEGRRLFISDVVHKVSIDVDETGSVAAAATGAMAAIDLSAPDMSQPIPFIADHPFFYIIRDPTGQILFMGRVVDPLDDGAG